MTTFGESHGAAIGGVIDGCPAGILLDKALVEKELSRRKPGQNTNMSARKEPDEVEYLSGLFEGKTTGAPIAFLIRNKDAKTSDYENIKDVFRPSHADFTYQIKYGIRDYAGGGRGSARTLLPCVVAGAIAKQILATQGVEISSEVIEMGEAREKDTVGAIIQGTIKNAPVEYQTCGPASAALNRFQIEQ